MKAVGVLLLVAAAGLALFQAWLWLALFLGLGTATGEEHLVWLPGLVTFVLLWGGVRFLRQ